MNIPMRASFRFRQVALCLKRGMVLVFALACLVPGLAMAVTYTDNGNGTVTDPGTGLTWMRCAMGQTWTTGGTCSGTATTYTWDQAAALTTNFASQSDWRVPNILELQSVVDRTRTNPAVNPTAFPATPSSSFWSSTPSAGNSSNAWYVYTGTSVTAGSASMNPKTNAFGVRMVRGQSTVLSTLARPTFDFVDGGDGTVTHTPTGLVWKRCLEAETLNGTACTTTGTGHFTTWSAAKALAITFAGNSDWRLPTMDELLTLVDYTHASPALNNTVFPNTPYFSYVWSSTPVAGSSTNAWGVYFETGSTYDVAGASAYQVRMVRGGAGSSTTTSVPTTTTTTISTTSTTTSTTTTTQAPSTTTTSAATTTSTTSTGSSTTTTASTATTTTAGATGGGATLNFNTGWNLVGNSTGGTLDVAAAFGDANSVSTVWKWVPSKSNWAFYTPAQPDGGAAYASGKGYDFLASVYGGEGFWVNAKSAFAAQLPAGTSITSASFQSLASGWNLIATGDNPTASAFNKALSLTTPAVGEIPLNLVSLWAWDAVRGNWYFYAPALDANGTLSSYISGKAYLDFGTTKTLSAGTGFWVNKSQSGSTGPGIVTGTATTITTQNIGTGGGTVTVNKPNDPLNGMEIVVPPSAYNEARDFKISSATVGSHSFGTDFNPLTPLITVENGGGYSSDIMAVKIPVTVPAGHFAMGFIYNDTTKELEGLPTLAQDASSITVATRHFSQVIVSSIEETRLTDVDTGFKPGVDDWQFRNEGSYIAPYGHCTGQSMTAMWYFYERPDGKDKSLFGRYDNNGSTPATPGFQYDDSLSYRFASVVWAEMTWGSLSRSLSEGRIWGGMVALSDTSTWRLFAYSMRVSRQPQMVEIWDTKNGGGHALVVYQIKDGNLYVADPNFPGDTKKWIAYANGKFTPYASGATAVEIAAGQVTVYDKITYVRKDALSDWAQIGAHWAELKAGTIGKAQFPGYGIYWKDAEYNIYALQDGYVSPTNSLDLFANTIANDTQRTHYAQITIYRDGAEQSTNLAELNPGNNRLGFLVKGEVSDGKGNYSNEYVDFRYFNIAYNPPPGPGASWSVVSSGLPFAIKPVSYYTVSAADTIQMARFGTDLISTMNNPTIQIDLNLARIGGAGSYSVSSDSLNKPTGVMNMMIFNSSLLDSYTTVSGSVNIISTGNTDGTPLSGTFDVILESDQAQAPKAQYRLLGSFSYPYTSQFGYGSLN